ncbi:MAG: SsrA-binding protein SmpB [Bacilli bacterium]|nr:SsrA-binding protein SmpB [Bacilli bacterium]
MENIKVIARNKKAAHEYFFLETFECGIVLTGTEIKSVRLGQVSISEAYCQVKDNELFMIGMNIAKFDKGNIFNHQETRERKLLAHRKEIKYLAKKVILEGLTLIPTEIYLEHGLAKVNIVLAKGKKSYDKREDLKQKDLNLEVKKAMKRQ